MTKKRPTLREQREKTLRRIAEWKGLLPEKRAALTPTPAPEPPPVSVEIALHPNGVQITVFREDARP